MRRIFTVLAWIVDANGTYNILNGFPQTFDSRNYNNDPDKALTRARGAFHEAIGAMCKNDTRKLQSIVLLDEGGILFDSFTVGTLAEPEPSEE